MFKIPCFRTSFMATMHWMQIKWSPKYFCYTDTRTPVEFKRKSIFKNQLNHNKNRNIIKIINNTNKPNQLGTPIFPGPPGTRGTWRPSWWWRFPASAATPSPAACPRLSPAPSSPCQSATPSARSLRLSCADNFWFIRFFDKLYPHSKASLSFYKWLK